MKKIYLYDRIYIPKSCVDRFLLKKSMVKRIYNESVCAKCPYGKGSGDCYQCPALLGVVKLYKETDKFIGIPVGYIRSLKAKLNIDIKKFKVVDKRPYPKFRNKIKFTGTLFKGEKENQANQVSIVNDWLKYKNGTIIARPRTGKTVIGLYCAIALGYRTIVIAHQVELLKQFRKRMLEITNIRKLEKKLGHKICGIPQSDEDLKKFDIVLCTYQSFISDKGKDKVKKYLNNFGMLIVDEAHLTAAKAFSQFIVSLNTPHRLALTATPERKDGMSFLLPAMMGPEVSRSTSAALIPTIKILNTGIKTKNNKNYSSWVYCMKFLCGNRDRNKLIVKEVFRLLREGRNVLIATDFRGHVSELVNLINTQAKINNYKRGEKWPLKLAVGFMAGSDRDGILKLVEEGVVRVTVAIRGMVKHGLDVRMWDTVMSTIPTNNPALFYQLACRCCTPQKEGVKKNIPLVIIFRDEVGQSIGCLRSLYSKEIKPGLYGKDVKYVMDKVDRAWCI